MSHQTVIVLTQSQSLFEPRASAILFFWFREFRKESRPRRTLYHMHPSRVTHLIIDGMDENLYDDSNVFKTSLTSRATLR